MRCTFFKWAHKGHTPFADNNNIEYIVNYIYYYIIYYYYYYACARGFADFCFTGLPTCFLLCKH